MRFEYKLSPSLATEWRPVLGYEGIYEVSDLGHVRRVSEYRNGRAGMIMAVAARGETGYLSVALSRNGRCTNQLLHRVVIEAFRGKRPTGMETHHIDGDKQNPRLSNLEFVTSSENTIAAYRSGVRAARGVTKPNAKLNDEIAREIFTSREPRRVLAGRYGVNISVVDGVRQGRAWKHATDGMSRR